MKRNMHENSLAAYGQERAHLSDRAFRIYKLLAEHPEPMTDRQIMETLGFHEPNAVRPRITELVNKHGLVCEVGKVCCPVTGKAVREVQAKVHVFQEDAAGQGAFNF